MNWSAKQSLKLNAEVVWLLQYRSVYTEGAAKERSMIIIDKFNINYIDTFDSLHDANAKHPASRVWFGHHTPLGNQIVCNVIFKHLRYKKYLLETPHDGRFSGSSLMRR